MDTAGKHGPRKAIEGGKNSRWRNDCWQIRDDRLAEILLCRPTCLLLEVPQRCRNRKEVEAGGFGHGNEGTASLVCAKLHPKEGSITGRCSVQCHHGRKRGPHFRAAILKAVFGDEVLRSDNKSLAYFARRKPRNFSWFPIALHQSNSLLQG